MQIVALCSANAMQLQPGRIFYFLFFLFYFIFFLNFILFILFIYYFFFEARGSI